MFPRGALPRAATQWFGLAAGLLGLAGCATPAAAPVDATACFLAESREQVRSEILRGEQKIVMNFELVDGLELHGGATVDGVRGHWIPAGLRRLQFRVFLPPVGWNNGRGREARAAVEVKLQPGHRYRISHGSGDAIRSFVVVDSGSGEAVTSPVDVGFFAPVPGTTGFIPIVIPVPR